MKNQHGIAWAPLLIIIGVIVVAGFAVTMLMQANNTDESGDTNVAVVNQANSNTNENLNTNNTTNTSQVGNSNADTIENTDPASNTNTVSNENTETDTSDDPTAEWETYTNTTHGFSIKYPSGVSVVEPCGTTGTLVTYCVAFTDATGKEITVFVHPSTDIVADGWFSAVEITGDNNEIISGISWRRIATEGGQSANQADRLGRSAIVVKGEQSFSVTMSYLADFDAMIARYNDMLQTFTFTD